ncbi:MAG: TetR/AcrR family transcriptional regulator [Rhodothermales bacterium]|nr:TetR/AcrR family transcriptional regulator [Rhodothermales bacterium]MBO6779288.1 TetR/AcrR family transcriptional regulator [Rhodothermales bacterium]
MVRHYHTVAYGEHTEPYGIGCVAFEKPVADRKDWIDAALVALLEHGSPNVKVERLARRLGVTKGSFYWHFKDREDLLRQTAVEWHADQLSHLKRLESRAYESAADRLQQLIAFTTSKDGTPDVAMRLWARQARWVNELVAEIDRLRLAYCIDVFQSLGFTGDQAHLRANMVYYYQVAGQTVSHKDPVDVRRRLDALRVSMLAPGSA